MVDKKGKKTPSKKKDVKKTDKKLTKKQIQDKQVMWTIILMVSLILIIILVPFIVKNYINKFVYIKLDWQKTKLGKIDFYSTEIPVADRSGNIIGTYTMNFRNDPRKLENINTGLSGSEIGFNTGEVVYISLDSKMQGCEDVGIGLINFAGFLRGFANLEVNSSVNDLAAAQKNNLEYITCENSPDNTVIQLSNGDENKIERIKTNCYSIVYKDCEITQVTEKFSLIILENYMSYFTKERDSFLDWFR